GGGSTVCGVTEDADCLTRFLCVERDGERGTYAVMADGKVRFIKASIDKNVFRSMCCINQEKKIDNLDQIAPVLPRDAEDAGEVEAPKDAPKENPAKDEAPKEAPKAPAAP